MPVTIGHGSRRPVSGRQRGRKTAVNISPSRAEWLYVSRPISRTIGVMTESRPLFPPFTYETAWRKVQAAEDAWNTRDPEGVSLGYTPDSQWRNRSEHVVGRAAIVECLTRKW